MTQTKTDDDTTRVEEEPSASAALTDGGEKGEPVAEGEMFLIGIGASAGGLEAIRELLKNAPAEVPGAYVVVQHMSPKHKSLLRSLIDRETHLKVVDLESGMQPQENAVYVTPPRNDVVYQDGKLFLVEPSTSVASPKPSVDRFFVSLAEGAGTHAIGIILSGTGSDGAYGVQAIRGAGGTTFAQHEKTAKYDGMPLAAVNTGCVDLVMAPDEIGQHLAKLPGSLQMTGQLELSNETPDLLQELFHILHARCNVDFREYKATTVQRRIERRMAARGLADLAAYVRRCRMEPEEVDALFRDLLISVTRFFRDKTEFESLREYIVALLNARTEGPLRIWVAGCATGEEAYSIAMMVGDILGGPHHLDKSNVQIFATDIDENALGMARSGRYPIAALNDVPKEMVEQYFKIEGDSVCVKRMLRDVVLFSYHNICQDAPFLRLDLVCCRNLLIYFDTNLQDRVLSRLHYALNPTGLLFLGVAESVTVSSDLFRKTAADLNLFSRRIVANMDYAARGRRGQVTVDGISTRTGRKSKQEEDSADITMFESLARGFAKNAMLFNGNFNVLRVYGEMTRYITLGEGANPKMDCNILIKPLAVEARVLITSALSKGERQAGAIRRINEDPGHTVQLEAIPLVSDSLNEPLVLVTFQRQGEPKDLHKSDTLANAADADRISALQQELDSAQLVLHQTIEELQSSNEEMQATNEELLALNEELETSNEELQSTNEELVTVNEELQIATSEMALLSEEQDAILESIGLPVLVVDAALQVNKASRAAMSYFRLRTPLERPHISQCALPPGFPILAEVVDRCLTEGKMLEENIETSTPRLTLRCSPFTNAQGQIRGVILICLEPHDGHRVDLELRHLYEHSPAAIIARDETGRICRMSESAARMFGAEHRRLIDQPLSAILAPEHAEQMVELDKVFMESKATSDTRLVEFNRRNDGRSGLFSVTRLRVHHIDGRDTLYSIAVDQADAEQQRLLNERLAMLPQMSGFTHWTVDLKTGEMDWPDETYEIHGVNRKHFTPTLQSALDFYHPDDRARVTELVDKAIAAGEPFDFQARLVRADGQEILVETHGRIQRDTNGENRHLFGTFKRLD